MASIVQVADGILTMASGDKSGGKTFTTGFTPVEIVVYNDSPADIYYADGLFSTKPGATIRIPPNTDMPIPYTQNAQGFTLFWSSTSALTQSYQIIVKWSDVPLAVPYTPLTQQVAVANSVTISVTQSGSWNVSINNQPTVNVNGPVSVQGVSGGTAIGVSISSSVALNVQQSGTWTVDINTMPTVNINGPITVEGVSGGTAIGVQVQNDVTINGTVTVQFPSAQEVTLAATGPVSVTDLVLNTSDLALLTVSEVTIGSVGSGYAFTVAGDTDNTGAYPVKQFGYYDGIVLLVCSQNGTINNFAYDVRGVDTLVTPLTFPTMITYAVTTPAGNSQAGWAVTFPMTANVQGGNSPPITGTFYLLAIKPFAAAFCNVYLQTNQAVAGDTVQVWTFGIKAQTMNPTENPVQQQAASGEYAALEYTNGGSGAGPTGQSGSSSTTLTLLNSGGYAASLNWNAMSYTATVDAGTGVTAAFSLTLYFGGAMIATVSGNATINGNATITLPAGTWQPAKSVANSGVTVVAVMTVSGGTASGVSGTVNWGGVQMVEESVTPPVEVTSVA